VTNSDYSYAQDTKGGVGKPCGPPIFTGLPPFVPPLRERVPLRASPLFRMATLFSPPWGLCLAGPSPQRGAFFFPPGGGNALWCGGVACPLRETPHLVVWPTPRGSLFGFDPSSHGWRGLSTMIRRTISGALSARAGVPPTTTCGARSLGENTPRAGGGDTPYGGGSDNPRWTGAPHPFFINIFFYFFL